jgi:hypothetical protein
MVKPNAQNLNKLIKLFQKAKNPYIVETSDGYISNTYWAIKKEYLEPLKEVIKPETKIDAFLLQLLSNKFESDKSIKKFVNFDYYAVRQEFKVSFYVLDIPELFQKIEINKNYADFIEAVLTENGFYFNSGERRLYYDEVWRDAYFVWFKNNIIAICYSKIKNL